MKAPAEQEQCEQFVAAARQQASEARTPKELRSSGETLQQAAAC